MRHAILAMAIVLWGRAATAEDLSRYAPAFVQRMQAENGHQELFLSYCLVGRHVCQWKQAVAFGNICNAGQATSMGYRDGPTKAGNLWGGEPLPGYRYAGWKCGETGAWHDAQTQDELDAAEVAAHPWRANEIYSYPGDVGKACVGNRFTAKGCATWASEQGMLLARCAIHNQDGSCPQFVPTAAGLRSLGIDEEGRSTSP